MWFSPQETALLALPTTRAHTAYHYDYRDNDTTKAAFLGFRAAVAKAAFGDTAVTETTGDVTKIDLQPYKGTPHAFVFEEEEQRLPYRHQARRYLRI